MNIHQLAILNIEERIKQALREIQEIGTNNFCDGNGEHVISRRDIKEIVKSLLYMRNTTNSLKKYYGIPEPSKEIKKDIDGLYEKIKDYLYEYKENERTSIDLCKRKARDIIDIIKDTKPDGPCNEIIKEGELEKERAEKPENEYNLRPGEGERIPIKEIPIKKWIWLKEFLYEFLMPEMKDLNLTPDLSSKDIFPVDRSIRIHIYKPTGRMKFNPREYEYEYKGTKEK